MNEVRTPEKGDSVIVVLADRTIEAEVVSHSPQKEFHSEDAPAVIVKVEGVENTFAHKTKGGIPPYWEWPAEVKEEKADDR